MWYRVFGGGRGVRVVPAIVIPLELAVMMWPAMVVVVGMGVLWVRGIVLMPMTRADGSRCTGMPDMVIGGAPGVKVVPAMDMPCESGWITWLFMVLVWPGVKSSNGLASMVCSGSLFCGTVLTY